MQGNRGVKLYNEHWCDHVPKSVEKSHEVKVTKCEPTELFLTINWTSQSVIIMKEHACE